MWLQLYKKTSNEILAELKAVVKTVALKVLEVRHILSQAAATDLLWQACVKQPALTHTPRHHREEGRRRNFSSCSDDSRIKTTAIFSTLTFEFEYFFFRELLSLQHKTMVLWYSTSIKKNQRLKSKTNERKNCLNVKVQYSYIIIVPTSPAVTCMSGSSNFDSFRDGWYVAVQLLLCGVWLPGFVQYCPLHSCVVAVKFFLHPFS